MPINQSLQTYNNTFCVVDSLHSTETTLLKVNHHNNPSNVMYSIVRSPVTMETNPLILSKVDYHNDPSHTMYRIAHLPITTNTASLTLCPPKVDHSNNPSHTKLSIAH